MQNRAIKDGDCVMVCMDGRDPAFTSRSMAELWHHATTRNMQTLRWEIGFFNLRDLQRAREPYHDQRPYKRRVEGLYGVRINVACLCDAIVLIVADGERETRLVAERGPC